LRAHSIRILRSRCSDYVFFSDHPLTHFCQLSFTKGIMDCPYPDQLGVVLSNWFRLGNLNASLFATEGVASVGPLFAPISALVCGLVLAIGNKVSAGLPKPFIFVSAAAIPHILLNVPLATTLLSHGLGLLFLLWYVTPPDYFEQRRELPGSGRRISSPAEACCQPWNKRVLQRMRPPSTTSVWPTM
jgi:hypothetical protein